MKKDMKREQKPKTKSVLQPLYDNKVLRVKVDEALDNEVPYEKIIGLCAQYGVNLSKPSLTRYKVKRNEAKENGVDLGELVDKRAKDEYADIEDKQVVEETGDVKPIINDLQVLDLIIDKTFEGVSKSKGYPSLKDGLKAMELRAKLTDNKYHGMTVQGFNEMKIRKEAQIQAITEAMLKFVPEDKQEEAMASMKKAEEDFYTTLNLTESEKRIKDQLKDSGIDM